MKAIRSRRAAVAGFLSATVVLGTVAVPVASAAPSIHATVTGHWQGPAPTKTPMSATDRAALQATADATLAGWKGAIPGVWVGVWDPKKGWAIVSSGNAQVDGAVATKVDHSRIGSVTKTFVATQILKLVDAGKLSLSSTIGDLLRSVAKAHPYVRNVTVKQMLGMRSGIPDYTEVPGAMANAYNNPEQTWTAAQLIELGLASATKLGEPKYSNTNYILLGEIAEKVTGKSIFDLVNADVRRLGMKQTRLPLPGRKAMPTTFSHGYNYLPGVISLAASGVEVEVGSEQQDDVTQWGQAAGSMYSTVADMGKWAATGLGLSELSPALAAQRIAAKPISGGAIQYGFGMESFGNNWVGHDGQAIGWESRVAYNTKTGAALVILVNETGSLRNVLPIAADYFPDLVG